MLEDTKDGKTRWIQLRIPVTEGPRYRMGELAFEGNKLVPSDALRTLFKVEPGEWYSRKKLDDGNKKAQEVYGGARLHGVHAVPDVEVQRRPEQSRDGAGRAGPDGARACPSRPTATAAAEDVQAAGRRRHDADQGGAAVLRQPHHLHRQHDDARQRDPPRDAAGRRQRLQHRGAQVQRPPPESARLLQGARRATTTT